ncbi:hypothetical protein [Sulfuriflexus mobilis]|nr:hypothetical protein [Sulfuriflexus mobilis]
MDKILDKYYAFHRYQMAENLAKTNVRVCYVPAPEKNTRQGLRALTPSKD